VFQGSLRHNYAQQGFGGQLISRHIGAQRVLGLKTCKIEYLE
jgi:hypothetical protein